MNGNEFLQIVDALHRDKALDKGIVFKAIEHALHRTIGKHLAADTSIAVEIDQQTGDISVTCDGEPLDRAAIDRLLTTASAQTAKQVFVRHSRVVQTGTGRTITHLPSEQSLPSILTYEVSMIAPTVHALDADYETFDHLFVCRGFLGRKVIYGKDGRYNSVTVAEAGTRHAFQDMASQAEPADLAMCVTKPCESAVETVKPVFYDAGGEVELSSWRPIGRTSYSVGFFGPSQYGKSRSSSLLLDSAQADLKLAEYETNLRQYQLNAQQALSEMSRQQGCHDLLMRASMPNNDKSGKMPVSHYRDSVNSDGWACVERMWSSIVEMHHNDADAGLDVLLIDRSWGYAVNRGMLETLSSSKRSDSLDFVEFVRLDLVSFNLQWWSWHHPEVTAPEPQAEILVHYEISPNGVARYGGSLPIDDTVQGAGHIERCEGLIFDLETSDEILHFRHRDTSKATLSSAELTGIEFSPDGSLIAVAGNDGLVIVRYVDDFYDPDSNELLHSAGDVKFTVWGQECKVRSSTFIQLEVGFGGNAKAGNDFLLTISTARNPEHRGINVNRVLLTDVGTGLPVWQGRDMNGAHVETSPSGKVIVSANANSPVNVWKRVEGTLTFESVGNVTEVSSDRSGSCITNIHVINDAYFVLHYTNGHMSLFHVGEERTRQVQALVFDNPGQDKVPHIDYDPYNEILAVGSRSEFSFWIFDQQQGRLSALSPKGSPNRLFPGQNHTKPIQGISFSKPSFLLDDESRFAGDRYLPGTDIAIPRTSLGDIDAAMLASLLDANGLPNSYAGLKLLSGGEDRKLFLYSLDNLDIGDVLGEHILSVAMLSNSHFTLSADGRRVVILVNNYIAEKTVGLAKDISPKPRERGNMNRVDVALIALYLSPGQKVCFKLLHYLRDANCVDYQVVEQLQSRNVVTDTVGNVIGHIDNKQVEGMITPNVFVFEAAEDLDYSNRQTQYYVGSFRLHYEGPENVDGVRQAGQLDIVFRIVSPQRATFSQNVELSSVRMTMDVRSRVNDNKFDNDEFALPPISKQKIAFYGLHTTAATWCLLRPDFHEVRHCTSRRLSALLVGLAKFFHPLEPARLRCQIPPLREPKGAPDLGSSWTKVLGPYAPASQGSVSKPWPMFGSLMISALLVCPLFERWPFLKRWGSGRVGGSVSCSAQSINLAGTQGRQLMVASGVWPEAGYAVAITDLRFRCSKFQIRNMSSALRVRYRNANPTSASRSKVYLNV